MHKANCLGLLRGGPVRKALAAILVVEAVVIILVVGYERASRRTAPTRLVVANHPHSWGRPLRGETILRPPVLRATDAKLGPEELVIGVEVGGRARAYRVAALETHTRHLVNDLVGGVPVSVAYCNVTHCIRVYTDPRSSQPLDAEVYGLVNGQMVIRMGETLFFQDSGMAIEPDANPPAMPYQLLTPIVTTWKEWTRLHPDTEVYDGRS
jgi:hypothetical protein